MYKKIVLLILTAITLVSCGTSRKTVSHKSASSSLQEDVILYGKRYLGKPYRYAGKGPNAFDCSGFTSFVFREFGYRLSPSSAGQDIQVPSVRRKQDLAIGDLAFFEGRRKNGRVGHVGIVTEIKRNGEFNFIHASTNLGVIISSSTEEYYASRYLRGGRVLEDRHHADNKKANPSVQSADSKQSSIQNNKTYHVFTPARAKNDPRPPEAPVVRPQKTNEKELIAVNNEYTSAQSRGTQQAEEKPITLVQSDPLKNKQLVESTPPDKPEENTEKIVKQAIRRDESLNVPEPVELADEADTVHTVKMGETLYSISRQYNCSVEQLKAWNPEMSNVLRAGDMLKIKNE